ncbi:MAG: HD domain-containing protein [Rhodospirillales bacterium]
MTGPDIATLGAETIVAFVADIFEQRGAGSYLGEPVTMSEHMLQSAALAEAASAGEALVAAALLHDIGHFTHAFPEDALDHGLDSRHDEAGARVLTPFFPALVTTCVHRHVDAKRFLCATDPRYFARLSPASVQTLALQGGPMTDREVAAFRTIADLDAIVRVRLWDDAAKIPGAVTPPFAHYAPLLQRLVDGHRRP